MRFTRFTAAHWRGQLPLLVTLAGPVALAALGLWALNRTLAGWPTGHLAALNLPVVIWAMVGAFRASDRALRDGQGFVAGFAGYAGGGAVLLAAGTTLLAPASPQRTFTSDMAAPLPVQAALPERDGMVELSGDIGFELYNALATRLETGVPPRALRLDSAGGNIFAARGLARLVGEAGLATRVDGRCFSACTLVFAAGVPRSLGPEGRLGFHGYLLNDSANYGPVRHVDPAEEEEKDRAFLLERGVAPAFIARIHETPPDALWQPTREELRAAGVITGD